MTRPLRTLFWGLTHEHAAGKLASLRKLQHDFEIVAVVDDRARTASRHLNEVADTTGLRLVSESEADELEGIDVVFVETANAGLMEIAAKFIAKGVPLHCDKPCGEAMEPYRSLVEKCRAANLPFQIGYMYRGNPALQFAWKFAADGGLGEVAFIEADMNHDYGEPNYPGYIASFKGGILYNLGCHLVDMVLPMARGELREAHPFFGAAPGDPVGCRTAAASYLRFAGTDVLLRTSSRMPGGILCRRLRVDGTNGTLDLCPIERFDGGELKLALTLKNAAAGYASGRHEVNFGVQSDRYAPQLVELAAVLRGERPNGQDYDRDLSVHELTLKACGII
ncbi:MAG TPA: hypothetical protein DD637_06110 [Verrucomicrobia bacterium]|nr:hypothetical protein [Verrucomicrobiota bacterium]HCG20316.1 hypothetical protein [Verrucomicrobiota bacterium]